MPRYNHAFDVAFMVISDREDATDVTAEMLKKALLQRISDLEFEAGQGVGGFEEACGAPFDTYEIEDVS